MTGRYQIPAVATLLLATAAAQDVPKLGAPVRLEADGKVIDTVEGIGHAGPQMRDLDGDGTLELLVSSFGGTIRVFGNEGTKAEPRLVEREPLMAGGEPIRIHNW
jgi:hypothetical protein